MKVFDPRVMPKACVACKSENVTDTDELRPSGIAPKIRCENGHVTNGMPTRAFFQEEES